MKAFEHTWRTLGAMRLRTHAALLVLLSALFVAWSAWLILGRVAVYVRSERARLEVEQSVVQVNAPVDGVVMTCELRLGRRVAEGDAIMKLDARTWELEVDEQRATVHARRAAVAALSAQLEVEAKARDSIAQLVARTERAGKARVRANKQTSSLKQEESEVINRLHEAELASRLEAMRSRSDAENLRLQAEVTAEQAALDTSAAKTTLRDRDVTLAGLQKNLVDAENQLRIGETALKRLEFEVERRTVRASVSGTLTDVVPCTPGMTVTSTQRLATLLPDGEVRVVGYFPPQEAVGRVKQGQRAIVRVENYPWTQFGTLSAEVSQVGAEPRDGLVRVELRLVEQRTQIPAAHGLVASAEVETEQLSPARLLLRLAGQPWSTPSHTTAATSPPLRATALP